MNQFACRRTKICVARLIACFASSTFNLPSSTSTWREDISPPTINGLPAAGDLGCNPTLPVCASLTATDNCDGTLAVSCTPGPITGDPCARRQSFTYSVTDTCRNTTIATVTYTWREDTTPPAVTCPPDVEVCDGDPIEIGSSSAVDNCDGALPVTCTGSDGRPLTDPYPIGTTTVTCTAKDAFDNWASCSFVVKVHPCEPHCSLTQPGPVF